MIIYKLKDAPKKAGKTDLSDIIINNRREVILSEHKTPYKREENSQTKGAY